MIWQVSALAQSRLDYGRGILAIELQLPEIQGKAYSLLGYHNYMYIRLPPPPPPLPQRYITSRPARISTSFCILPVKDPL
jgi:hypothetical protein